MIVRTLVAPPCHWPTSWRHHSAPLVTSSAWLARVLDAPSAVRSARFGPAAFPDTAALPGSGRSWRHTPAPTCGESGNRSWRGRPVSNLFIPAMWVIHYPRARASDTTRGEGKSRGHGVMTTAGSHPVVGPTGNHLAAPAEAPRVVTWVLPHRLEDTSGLTCCAGLINPPDAPTCSTTFAGPIATAGAIVAFSFSPHIAWSGSVKSCGETHRDREAARP